MKNIYYHKLSRELNGPCNICGQFSKLTWDHIPPKNSFNRFPIKFNPLFDISEQDEIVRESTSQNGIRFRTLCSSCNNQLLGLQYDPVMQEYSENIRQFFTTDIAIPTIVHIDIKVNRLCRAICGHMLAAVVTFDDVVLVDKELRKYVLDPQAVPPPGMQLLTWPYPYGSVMIARNFVTSALNEPIHFPDGLASMISAFPAAYVLHNGIDNCGLVDLFAYCSAEIDETVSIPIDFDSMRYPGTQVPRSFNWPCDMSDTPYSASMVMGSKYYFDGSVFALQSIESINKILKRE